MGTSDGRIALIPGGARRRNRSHTIGPAREGAEATADTDPGGVGEPDGFARLWAPDRMSYVNGAESRRGSDCALCRVPALDDEAARIVHRGRHAYVVLNRYPYNNGHLMVVPFRHFADYAELTTEESLEICRLTAQAVQVLRNLARAEGFNIGMNLGEAGGAGIADHLHQHIVPRWKSDTNFMPVLGRTTVLPQLLGETWTVLTRGWA